MVVENNSKTVRNTVNRDVTTVKFVAQKIKQAKPPKTKLGEITIPNIATDFEVMILGIILETNMVNAIALSNRLLGLTTAYGALPPDEEARIKGYIESANLEVELQKAQISKVIAKHPLSNTTKIKGFTDYSLGVIMSKIKDPRRFDMPSKLFVWAGVAPKNNTFQTKSTILQLRKEKHDQYERGEEPEDFKEYGYNTKLQSKMYNVAESLIRAKGFFYNEYVRARVHLEQRAINQGECFYPTDEQIKESKGVMKKDNYYMHNKKHQSLIQWSHRNASWRQARTLLHIIYCEWLEILGEQARELYAIEYLGHSRKITLTEILEWEADSANKIVRVPKGLKPVDDNEDKNALN